MKLTFVKLPEGLFKKPDGWPAHPDCADGWKLSRLFEVWCQYKGIFIGSDKDHRTVEYNSMYHFYDVYLFALLGNGPEHQTAHFNRVKDLLTDEGVQVTSWGPSFRWHPPAGISSEKKMIPGVRFWIKPVEIARDDDEHLMRRAEIAINELSSEPNNTSAFWSARKVADDIGTRLGKKGELCLNTVKAAPGVETPPEPVPESKEPAEKATASKPSLKGGTKPRSSRAAGTLREELRKAKSRALKSIGATKSTSKTRRRTTKSG